uniref:Pectate lyase n=1 Tax=viral metagenome TaxID=1070528 RepID=A0A6M3IW51_9ZZZZ
MTIVTSRNIWKPVSSAGPTYLVAAYDAPAWVKAKAHYVCDYVSGDDHLEINDAITKAAALKGGVLLSEGTFSLGASLSVPYDESGIRLAFLKGQGMRSTVIRLSGSLDGIVIADDADFYTMSDFQIYHWSKSTGHGIRFAGESHNFVFENIDIFDTSAGWMANIYSPYWIWMGRWNNCRVNNCDIGWDLYWGTTLKQQNCYVAGYTTAGWRLGLITGISMDTPTAESGGTGWDITHQTSYGPSQLDITNMHVEAHNLTSGEGGVLNLYEGTFCRVNGLYLQNDGTNHADATFDILYVNIDSEVHVDINGIHMTAMNETGTNNRFKFDGTNGAGDSSFILGASDCTYSDVDVPVGLTIVDTYQSLK